MIRDGGKHVKARPSTLLLLGSLAVGGGLLVLGFAIEKADRSFVIFGSNGYVAYPHAPLLSVVPRALWSEPAPQALIGAGGLMIAISLAALVRRRRVGSP